jgi:hypothetical protein
MEATTDPLQAARVAMIRALGGDWWVVGEFTADIDIPPYSTANSPFHYLKWYLRVSLY